MEIMQYFLSHGVDDSMSLVMVFFIMVETNYCKGFTLVPILDFIPANDDFTIPN